MRSTDYFSEDRNLSLDFSYLSDAKNITEGLDSFAKEMGYPEKDLNTLKERLNLDWDTIISGFESSRTSLKRLEDYYSSLSQHIDDFFNQVSLYKAFKEIVNDPDTFLDIDQDLHQEDLDYGHEKIKPK